MGIFHRDIDIHQPESREIWEDFPWKNYHLQWGWLGVAIVYPDFSKMFRSTFENISLQSTRDICHRTAVCFTECLHHFWICSLTKHEVVWLKTVWCLPKMGSTLACMVFAIRWVWIPTTLGSQWTRLDETSPSARFQSVPLMPFPTNEWLDPPRRCAVIIVPSKKGEVLEVDIHGRGDAWQLKNTSPNGNSPDLRWKLECVSIKRNPVCVCVSKTIWHNKNKFSKLLPSHFGNNVPKNNHDGGSSSVVWSFRALD